MLTEMQRFVSVKIGCYDSALGGLSWTYLPQQVWEQLVWQEQELIQSKKKRYNLYLLRNIPLWGKHITQSNIVTEINVKLQLWITAILHYWKIIYYNSHLQTKRLLSTSLSLPHLIECSATITMRVTVKSYRVLTWMRHLEGTKRKKKSQLIKP